MNNALVSIIVPVYNAGLYLQKCIDSITCQDYEHIEIICVNDGSTDSSLEILKHYAAKDDRILILSQTNQGVSSARNIALKYATGDYIMFIDSDDWIDSTVISSCINTLVSTNADIIMFPYKSEHKNMSLARYLFDKTELFEGSKQKTLARAIIGPIGEEIINPVNLDRLGTLWAKIYRKDILEGLSFSDLKEIGTAEDTLFNIHAMKRANRVVYNHCDIFYHYRKYNISSETKRFKANLGTLWENLYKKINKVCQSKEELLALNNRIALNLLGRCLNNLCTDKGIIRAYNLIKYDLNNQQLYTAIKQIDISHLPIHWKIYFWFAKHRMAIGITSMSWLIQQAINKN